MRLGVGRERRGRQFVCVCLSEDMTCLLLSSEQTDAELRRLRFILTPAPSISSRRLACGEDSIVQTLAGGQEHGVGYKSGQVVTQLQRVECPIGG